MEDLKSWLKRYVIPKGLLDFIRPFYHGCLALLASLIYGKPSGKMIVIGITGTAGKSTTAQMLARILNRNHKKCGFITTISFFDGGKEQINKHGLSMPGGFLLQRQLKLMLQNGCGYAVVECTSEGLRQNRHWGINFDLAIFTNLSPAHLEAHGGFENYKKAKGKLFTAVFQSKAKPSPFFPFPEGGGGGRTISKTIIVNADDQNSEYFAKFKVDTVIKCAIKNKFADFVANDIKVGESAITYKLQATRPPAPRGNASGAQVSYKLNLVGEFNIMNALLAAAAAKSLGVGLKDCAEALESFKGAPGRMEMIQNFLGVKIFVDYGCEPESFRSALLAAAALPHNRLIHVFGSTGGHRDVGKRFEFGKISARYSDYIIITNDDVYDSNPEKIVADIESGIRSVKNKGLKVKDYQIILDRHSAIRRALALAQKDDIVLITGKGSEQFLVLPGNKRIAWDDRVVARENLKEIV